MSHGDTKSELFSYFLPAIWGIPLFFLQGFLLWVWFWIPAFIITTFVFLAIMRSEPGVFVVLPFLVLFLFWIQWSVFRQHDGVVLPIHLSNILESTIVQLGLAGVTAAGVLHMFFRWHEGRSS